MNTTLLVHLLIQINLLPAMLDLVYLSAIFVFRNTSCTGPTVIASMMAHSEPPLLVIHYTNLRSISLMKGSSCSKTLVVLSNFIVPGSSLLLHGSLRVKVSLFTLDSGSFDNVLTLKCYSCLEISTPLLDPLHPGLLLLIHGSPQVGLSMLSTGCPWTDTQLATLDFLQLGMLSSLQIPAYLMFLIFLFGESWFSLCTFSLGISYTGAVVPSRDVAHPSVPTLASNFATVGSVASLQESS